MMKRISKSYNMNNKGSAIITALVVSAVLLVLCLSLLLVAFSLFTSSVSNTTDFSDREYIYSVVEEVERELTGVNASYTDTQTLYSFFTDENDNHKFWDYIRCNLWQGFEANSNGAYDQRAEDSNITGGIWPYYKENETNNHGNLEKCSKYFTLNTEDQSKRKVIAQFYWELPENWNGTLEDKNGTILHAIYRMYGNNGEVISKVEKIYKLDMDMVKPLKNYTITFYAIKDEFSENSVSGKLKLGSMSIYEGEAIITPPNFNLDLDELSGYKFRDGNWFYVNIVSSEGEENPLNEYSETNIWDFNSVIENDLELYIICVKNKVTATFHNINPNDSNEISVQEVTIGEKVDKPSTPTCDDYIFVDWYKSSSTDAVKWDFSDRIYDNVDIYAKWKKIHTVTFELRNGLDSKYSISKPDGFDSETYSVKVKDGNTVDEPSPEPKAVFENGGGNIKTMSLDGWYLAGSSTKFSFDSPITTNITLYAKWVNDYFAYFEKNNFAVLEKPLTLFKRSVKGKDHDIKEPDPSKDDEVKAALTHDYFEFVDWYNTDECKENDEFDFSDKNKNKNEVYIYAKWRRTAYKTYFALGSCALWSDDIVSECFENSLTEKWKIDTEGTLCGPVLINNVVPEPNMESVNINVIGYRFMGWDYSINKTDKNENETIIESNINEPTTKWNFNKALNYSSYDHDNNIIEIVLTADWASEYKYEFYDRDLSLVNNDYEMIYSDNNYYIQDEVGTDGFKRQFEEVKKHIKNNSENNYRFLGWMTEKGVKLNSIDDIVSEDHADQNHIVKLFAIWDKEYSINFFNVYKAGSSVESIINKTEIEINEMISAGNFYPNISDNDLGIGYEIKGWSYSIDEDAEYTEVEELKSTPIDTDKAEDGVINIYAKRKDKTYVIEFYTETGERYSNNAKLPVSVSTIPTKTTLEDSILTSAGRKDRTGYKFDGWIYMNVTLSDKVTYNLVDGVYKADLNFNNADSNNVIALKESWVLKEYNINYHNVQMDENFTIVNYDDVTNNNSSTYNISQSQIELKPNKRIGSDFCYWAQKVDGQYLSLNHNLEDTIYYYPINANNPQNIDVYAVWKTQMCTVTFDTFGATQEVDENVAYNQKATIPAITKEGFWFVDWYTSSDLNDESKWNFATNKVTESIRLYAKMNIAIKFNSGEGYFLDEESNEVKEIQIRIPYKTKIDQGNLPSDPIRDNYEFSHWQSDKNISTEDILTDTVQFNAVWNKVGNYTVRFANGEYNGKPSPEVNQSFLPDPIPDIGKDEKIDFTNPKVGDFALGNFGWYKDKGCTTPYNFNMTLGENFYNLPDDVKEVTLYAKWDNSYNGKYIPRRVRFLNDNTIINETIMSNNTVIKYSDAIVTQANGDIPKTKGHLKQWKTSKGTLSETNTKYTITEDTDFVAEFKGFKIIYDLKKPEGGKYVDYVPTLFGKIEYSIPYEYRLEIDYGYDEVEYNYIIELKQNPKIYAKLDPENIWDWVVNLYDSITNSFKSKVTNYYFVGFYKDEEYKIPVKNGETIYKDTTIYAKWITDKEMAELNNIQNNGSIDWSNSLEIEFEKWYSEYFFILDFYSWFHESTAKQQARIYWYNNIYKPSLNNNSSSGNSETQASAGNNNMPGILMLNDTSYDEITLTNLPVVYMNYMSPNEEDIGSSQNIDDENNNESIDINETPEPLEPKYAIEDTYKISNSSVNPYGFKINPRELWSWKKVG